ncbi:MAG: hypothetical protein QJR03_04705 [Sphaerobacter sp.]|nr:hypothetical protein [Sphaerobacter sp.]
MRDLTRRFLAAWRLELRLLVRHWAYPLLLAAWSAFVIYVFRDQAVISPEAALNRDLGHFSIGISSLAALLLGAAGAGRSQRTRFASLEESYPTGAEVLLGRWLAGVVALLPTQVAAVAIAGRAGPASSLWRGLPTFVLEATITVAFCTAVGWLLVSWLGPRRWVYPLLAGGWLGCLGLPVFLGRRNLGIPGAELLDFMRSDTGSYEELWGRLFEGALPVWFNLFYAGLAALGVALVVARVAARRRRRAPLVPAALALAALVVAAASATAYVQQVRAWEARAVDRGKPRPLPGPGDLATAAVETIDAWEIAVDLTDPASPRFDARFTLRNAGSEPITAATLTLHRDLAITMSSLPYARDGDVLTLTLSEPLAPGATRDLRLAYAGPIWAFIAGFDQTPYPVTFTAADGVRLAHSGGWYPVPGRMLAPPDWSEPTHPPAAFHLAVTVPEGWGVFSNLPATGDTTFASERATWVVLFASPRLRTEQVGASTIVAPEALLPRARALIPEYEAVLADLARYFPGPAPKGLTLAILDSLPAPGMPYQTPPAGCQPLVVISQSTPEDVKRYAFDRRYFIGTALAADLWSLAGGDPDGSSVFDGAQFYLWARHVAGDDPKRFEQELTASGMPYAAPVARALREVDVRHGEAGLREVIARMIAEEETLRSLEPDELAAWVREVAGAP